MKSPLQLADEHLYFLIYEERKHFHCECGLDGEETREVYKNLIKEHSLYRLLTLQAILNTSHTTYEPELEKLMDQEYDEFMGIDESEEEEIPWCYENNKYAICNCSQPCRLPTPDEEPLITI